MADWERKEIDVAKLTIDLGNFRIGDQDDVRAAYHAMISEEGQNLTNLAADLVELGTSPSELPIVVPDPEARGQYVVVEGNRRLTAIRMMETPALAAGTPLHGAFKSLEKEYRRRPIHKLFCVVMPDKATAMKWIDRKHMMLAGRGLSQWNAQATARADAFRGKVRPSFAVMAYLKSINELPLDLSSALAKRTTNVDRVFQMPYMKAALGVGIGKDGTITYESGDVKRGNSLLVKMLRAIAAKGFTVDDIRYSGDREHFIDGFASHGVLGKGKSRTSDAKPDSSKKSSAKPENTRRRAALDIDRTVLALKGREHRLAVQEARLATLYKEALNLSPSKLPSTGGVLTRVFLELSVDHFLTSKKIPLPKTHKDKGRQKWPDIGIPLREKITVALAELDPAKTAKFKEARKGLSDADALHSIQSLHDYVHSLNADPDPREVKRVWQRWHPFLHALFEALP